MVRNQRTEQFRTKISKTGNEVDPIDEDQMDDATIPCGNCGRPVYEDAPQCPYCGEYGPDTGRGGWSNKPRWLTRLAVVLIVLTALAFALPYLLTLLNLFR